MTEQHRPGGNSSADKMIALLRSVDETLKRGTGSSLNAEWLGKWLASIDSSLRSIKNMLTFFVVLTIIGFIIGFCSAII